MKLTRLVPAVAAVALLAGCSPTPGTALIVDGAKYTEAQVDTIVSGCAEALGVDDNQIRRQGVVGTLLLGGLFDSLGLPTSDAEVLKVAAAQVPGTDQLAAVEGCRPLALANAKTQMLGQFDPAIIQGEAQNLDVQLNPKYGQWKPESAQLLDPSGSLSVPTTSFR